MSLIVRELWFAGRLLLRRPGYGIVAVLTLGLAIGACTAIYSVVYGVTIKPLPYPRSERIVQLWQVGRDGGRGSFSDPNFEDVRTQARAFAGVAEFSDAIGSVMVGSQALRARTASVSRDFFTVLATEPARGRRFAEEDLREGASAAILSHAFWQQHYAGTNDMTSAELRVRGRPHTVIGVMPSGFAFPAGVDIWLAREATARNPFRTGHNWRVVARLGDGVALVDARADATTVARRLKVEYGDGTWMEDVVVVPLQDQVVGSVRPVLQALLASVALLLLIACANLASLLLARVSGRRRDLAVRSALGATHTALIAPFLAESIILGTAAGVLGVAFGHVGVSLLRFTAPTNLPRLDEVRVSWPVLAFAFAVTALSTLLLGVTAAWRARRADVAEWLKDRHGAFTGGSSLGRLRSALVVAQLMLASVLLVGAALLGRSLTTLLSQDPGFRGNDLLAIDIATPGPAVRPTPDGVEIGDPASLPRQAEINQRLVERLGALPGVREAGGINRLPMSGGASNGTFVIVRGNEPQTMAEMLKFSNDPERTGFADFRVASAGYFRAMGIPLIRGRLFGDSDTGTAPHAAVISESLARTRWPNEDPIGLRIQFGGIDGDLRIFTIVGIVGDVRDLGLESEPRPTFYADYRQRPLSTFNFTIVLHATVPATSLVAEARSIVVREIPEVPPRFRTIEEVLGATSAGRRFTLGLTGLFAAAAVLLAVLGVYGVLSYLVAQRQHEFGVRMALGASASDVRRLVLMQSARLVAAGLALGLAAAMAMSGVLKGMLFGITATDPITYAAVAVTLASAALLACQVPAFRATRANPLAALKAE